MLSQKLQNFLETNQVDYRVIKHPPAYTAPEIAALSHISGKELAKVVVVKIDGKLAMVIEPSTLKLNMHALQEWFHGKSIELPSEGEFKGWFEGCEPGAMAPFGSLYDDMEVYEDDCLADLIGADAKIAFNGGTHTDLVEMDYQAFEKLAQPKKIHLQKKRGETWKE